MNDSTFCGEGEERRLGAREPARIQRSIDCSLGSFLAIWRESKIRDRNPSVFLCGFFPSISFAYNRGKRSVPFSLA